jgi:acetyl-CoA acyltransferase
MGDAVIVEAVRTPLGNGKPTGALAGVHPVDSISRDVRPALGTDPTPRYRQLRR